MVRKLALMSRWHPLWSNRISFLPLTTTLKYHVEVLHCHKIKWRGLMSIFILLGPYFTWSSCLPSFETGGDWEMKKVTSLGSLYFNIFIVVEQTKTKLNISNQQNIFNRTFEPVKPKLLNQIKPVWTGSNQIEPIYSR